MATRLFVHAHPDDESLWSGITIAQRALEGDDVIVLTCTLGQEGEVIPSATRRLELDPQESRDLAVRDDLAGLRAGELTAAVTTLGARSVLLPDVVGRQVRDSGMAGSAAAEHPYAFASADVADLAFFVARLIDERGVDEVVGYEQHGGYGHPDHVQAHRLARAAVLASTRRPRLSAIVVPQEWADEDRSWVTQQVDPVEGVVVPGEDDPHPPSVLRDLPRVGVFDDRQAAERRDEALRYHRTQVTVRDGWFMLSNAIAQRLVRREALVGVDPQTGEFEDYEALR